MAANSKGKSNRELLRDLQSPVAHFYPFDLHTHTIGSHDVCVGERYESLPESLKHSLCGGDTAASPSAVPSKYPLLREPTDHQRHDERIAIPHLVEAFYESLIARRDILCLGEKISPTDNWCVIGATDHNSAHFSTALSSLAWSRRTKDRIIVLPGIELEVSIPLDGATERCPLHILCLFPPTTSHSDIRTAVNDSRDRRAAAWSFGTHLHVDDLPAFIQAIRLHATYPCMCIAAHVWSKKGIQNQPVKMLFEAMTADITRLQGTLEHAKTEDNSGNIRRIEAELKAATDRLEDKESAILPVMRLMGSCGFDGLQVKDQSHEVHYRRLHRFRDKHGRAVPIVCSDAHTPLHVFRAGGNIPYLKLDKKVLSGGTPHELFHEIRGRAIRFGETRTTYSTPGKPTFWIEGIEITPDAPGAQRFWQHTPESSDGTITLGLSRNLNCFIGGRGSGKSSLIEALAFASDDREFSFQGALKQNLRPEWYNRAAATLSGCRVRLVWKTTDTGGIGSLPKQALIATRYFDADGAHSLPEYQDADGGAITDDAVTAPSIQLLRAHEIEQAAVPGSLRELFDELCGRQIAALSKYIGIKRAELATGREQIVKTCLEIATLSKDGSALRQYAVRKYQFESVDKPELQQRYEHIDQAENVANRTASLTKAWMQLGATATLGQLGADLNSFFLSATSTVLGADGTVLTGHERIHDVVRARTDATNSTLRAQVEDAIEQAKNAVNRGNVEFTTAETDAATDLQAKRDELAKDGLPTGSGARQAKKKAFDVALEDFHRYQALSTELIRQLQDRRSCFLKMVQASQKRTQVRDAYAQELTKLLKKDLDGDVLQIRVEARPLSDRSEFVSWIEKNMDAAFQRYRQQRRQAIVNSGLMPSTLRDILLDEGSPDMTPLQNEFVRAEDGKVSNEDCERILDTCRARLRQSLDGKDQLSEDFWKRLPLELQSGVIQFPLSGSRLRIDSVLALDEVVLDDTPEILLNDRPRDPQSEFRSLQFLSPGQRCSAILPLLLLSGSGPLIIDQPEENLDNRLIRQVIVNILASMKLKRQVIIATHNPNLPVLGDAEQCVILEAAGRDRSKLVANGCLDSPIVAKYITEIMEGGREAFQYRHAIYQSHWAGDVDES